MGLIKLLMALMALSASLLCSAQVEKPIATPDDRLPWFISVNAGGQLSGIKSEDFVRTNYSPLIYITAGKWFVPYLALQIGYKGYYFNYIGDEVRHHYTFLYGEAVLNINRLTARPLQNGKWSLLLHAGSGYFYNYNYDRPNICAQVGVQNNFQITSFLLANIDVAAIMGWDIYQKNKDILPGASIGFIYVF